MTVRLFCDWRMIVSSLDRVLRMKRRGSDLDAGALSCREVRRKIRFFADRRGHPSARRAWRIAADLAARLIQKARQLSAQAPIAVDRPDTVDALGSTTIDLCLAPVSAGGFSPHHSGRPTPDAAGSARADSLLRGDHRRALPRGQRPRPARDRAGSLPRHGPGLPRFRPAPWAPASGRLLRHPRQARAALGAARFAAARSGHRRAQRSARTPARILLAPVHSAVRRSFPDKLRVVRFDDAGQERRFGFLTHHPRRSALSIGQLDQLCWQVEFFFQFMTHYSFHKCPLRRPRAHSYSPLTSHGHDYD